MEHTVCERFLRYVKIDTQSDPQSGTFPSTMKQKDLGKVLVEELLEMGISDAHLDPHGYVYATIPATTDTKEIPTICLCSHMDTSPDASGKNVKPIIHSNYDGGTIRFPKNDSLSISPKDYPDLNEQIGNDVITADGTTLLGADDKAGVAAIMDAAHHLMKHPDIHHGKIRILFTPDEEIGKGVNFVNIEKLDADFGYTIDGEKAGSIQDETFSADGVVISITGVGMHPGMSKGKMVNAQKVAAEILANLPLTTLSPETTAGLEGFIHPTGMNGSVESATLQFIIRDFKTDNLSKHEAILRTIAETAVSKFPGSSMQFEVTEQYRNMKEVVDQHPEIMKHAEQAIQDAGLTPERVPIRGGTDGSRLSYMGLRCPNLFTGGHGFHSLTEWVSRQDMEKAAQVIVNLCKNWVKES